MKTKIYSLQDHNGNIRYIGKTIKNLANRLSAHLWEAKNGIRNHRCNWIRSVMSHGKWPSIFLIGEIEGNGNSEERAWIKYFRDEGIKLVNQTDGGDGKTGYKHTEEYKQKMSLRMLGKQYTKGHKCSEETKRKLRESQMGRHRSSESRKKQSKSQKGHIVTESTRKKLSVSHMGNNNPMFGKHPSEETRRKLSDVHKGKHLSLEHRKKISEATKGRNSWLKGKTGIFHHSEESKRKMSQAKKGHKPSKETIIKRSIALKKSWQYRKSKLQNENF